MRTLPTVSIPWMARGALWRQGLDSSGVGSGWPDRGDEVMEPDLHRHPSAMSPHGRPITTRDCGVREIVQVQRMRGVYKEIAYGSSIIFTNYKPSSFQIITKVILSRRN